MVIFFSEMIEPCRKHFRWSTSNSSSNHWLADSLSLLWIHHCCGWCSWVGSFGERPLEVLGDVM